MPYILHITPRAAWDEAQQRGEYRCATLEHEGFIHCSTVQQVMGVANVLFRGQLGLVLLCIAPDKLTAELRYEALGAAEAYPHIYGPVNLDAVVKVLDFPAGDEGWLHLPRELG